MLNNILKNISPKIQGIIAIVIGLILLFGSFMSLGLFKALFYTTMLVAGVVLLFWGIEKTEILKDLKSNK